jgi:hypothetical protein
MEKRDVLQTIQTRKANWLGHILRRNCFLKHVIEENIEERTEITERRGRRRKQLMDDLKEKGGRCKLKVEALDRTMYRTCFGRGYGPAVRQTRTYYFHNSSSRSAKCASVGCMRPAGRMLFRPPLYHSFRVI